jgi:glycosyltransferase involved in cell wall biosynthesis
MSNEHGTASETKNKIILSIVVPMYNESENVIAFYNKIVSVLEPINMSFEVVCVNDGSKDNTLELLLKIRENDPRLIIIDFSRNFGKEIALSAGIDFARGDAIIPIDADLQDPPELIPELISKWHEGYDVVYATRTVREGETFLKKFTSHLFYRTIRVLTRFDIPMDTGDFRLMDRRVAMSLKKLREQHRFMKGLFSWVGFKQISVPYQREPRYAGETKWNYWKLWNLALEGITSFSYVPLQFATYFGIIVSFLSFIYGVSLLIKTLIYGNPVPGYPSLMVVILFLGGVQLMTIGMIGEYIGRIYNESKRRPLYIVRETYGLNNVMHNSPNI